MRDSLGDPKWEDAVPLSEDEQRILREIEERLYETDPDLSRYISSESVYRHALRYMKWSALAFVVGLVASAERIAEIRRNRVHLLGDRNLDDYVDRAQIADELAYSRKLCARHRWPVIDVTRRSVEETAATIIRLMQDLKADPADRAEDIAEAADRAGSGHE